MAAPAYIVEGDLEKKFLQTVCPRSPIKKIGCNGDDVALECLSRFIATQARLLQRKYTPLIIIFDREKRQMTCQQIETKIRQLLIVEQVNVQIIIGIPDREIENWILADFEKLSMILSIAAPADSPGYEGKQGKSVIKSLLPSGKTYSETLDGPKWLKECCPERMAENSESFNRLYGSLKGLTCWWLEKRDDLI